MFRIPLRPFFAAMVMLVTAQAAYAADELPPGVGVQNPLLAFGLNGISDWSTEMPFLNLMKQARPWFANSKTAWGAISNATLKAQGYLDAEGWPKKLPPGMRSITTILAWSDNSAAEGVYALRYSGAGRIALGGDAKVLSRGRDPNQIVFENTHGGSIWLDIAATDPLGVGDYLRDISIVRRRYEGLYETGERFNPDWLNVVDDARELRFMDWMKTNDSTQGSWRDRPKIDDASYSEKGAPVEVMVALANQVGADPWFNMPTKATDNYVANFATYVRDHLAPGLVAHVEYSNETWNGAFRAYHWLDDQSRANWGVSAPNDYYVMRAAQIMHIWDRVFGATAKTRVDAVLATQTVNTWLTRHNLVAPIWREHDPSGYISPRKIFDSLAVTTYFGGSSITNAKLRSTLVDKIETSEEGAKKYLVHELDDPKSFGSLPWLSEILQKNRSIAKEYGLKLVAYEGGQSVLQAAFIPGLTKEQLAVTTPFLSAFVRSPEMADIYRKVWELWAKVGDGPFMQFTDVSAPSKWGARGLLSGLGDTNPRSELLFALNKSAKSWFGSGGGTQYQQGVIRIAGDKGEILTGTMKDDFLIGGTGDDMFVPGTGHDGINGGGGTNTMVLAGKAADYHLMPEAAGYRLTGPNVSDYVLNVQEFRFDDASRTLAEMLGR